MTDMMGTAGNLITLGVAYRITDNLISGRKPKRRRAKKRKRR